MKKIFIALVLFVFVSLSATNTKAAIISSTWGTSSVSFNDETKVLNVSAGTINYSS